MWWPVDASLNSNGVNFVVELKIDHVAATDNHVAIHHRILIDDLEIHTDDIPPTPDPVSDDISFQLSNMRNSVEGNSIEVSL